MRKQIIHISIHQSSKVLSLFAVSMMTVFAVIPLALYTIIHGERLIGILMLFLIPLFYAIIFYVVYAVSFWFYNFIAKHLGGIEFDLEDLGTEVIPHNQGHEMDNL